ELGPEAAVAVLSGPNLSGEVVRRVPTATVISARDEALARSLQQAVGTPFFRVYTNSDLAGVELGGALKNPIALAAGISDGLGYGNNTKATLLTRGLAEITRLGVAAGARPGTFSGLSGLGDLMATAHSPLSRNYRLGLALGRGDTREHALAELHQVAEGVPTTAAACRLAERLGVEVPITQALHGILFEERPLAEAVAALLARPYRDESGQAPL
ncbi:MAG TPA: NAD(P)H-dependent glycerol-3-phosphate dehydrogenase, partial [Armatimonadota bacterium]|nr:NAD(P)H-dependent glycerol-3-phosphate dehydrogenase [Armatimonadota bacterium]